MTEHDGLSALMYAETEDQPPSGIDLGRIVRDGKRRRRRRRLLPVAAAAMVLAVAAGAIGLADLRSESPPVGSAPAMTAPDWFEGPQWRIAVGWLPEPMYVRASSMGDSVQSLTYANDIVSILVEVSVYAGDVEPDLGAGSLSAAPAVAGRPAQWHRTSHGTVDRLVWRWADNAWATARFIRWWNQSGDGRDELRRIAESVRVDMNAPLRLPVRITPAPGLRLATISGGPTAFQVDFTVDGLEATADRGPAMVVVGVDWVDEGQTRQPANTMLGGHVAFVESRPDVYSVHLYDVDGYDVNLDVRGAALTAVTPDQAKAMAMSVTPVANPFDQTQWTDKPLG